MTGNAPQGGSSSEAVSQVTRQASPTAPQEKKPNIEKADAEFVNLVVYYQQDGSRTNFRVRRNSKLQKLVVQFCIHRCLDMKALRVLFEGTRLKLEKTAQELHLGDGDEIEVICLKPLGVRPWLTLESKAFIGVLGGRSQLKYGKHYDKPYVDIFMKIHLGF